MQSFRLAMEYVDILLVFIVKLDKLNKGFKWKKQY